MHYKVGWNLKPTCLMAAIVYLWAVACFLQVKGALCLYTYRKAPRSLFRNEAHSGEARREPRLSQGNAIGPQQWGLPTFLGTIAQYMWKRMGIEETAANTRRKLLNASKSIWSKSPTKKIKSDKHSNSCSEVRDNILYYVRVVHKKWNKGWKICPYCINNCIMLFKSTFMKFPIFVSSVDALNTVSDPTVYI